MFIFVLAQKSPHACKSPVAFQYFPDNLPNFPNTFQSQPFWNPLDFAVVFAVYRLPRLTLRDIPVGRLHQVDLFLLEHNQKVPSQQRYRQDHSLSNLRVFAPNCNHTLHFFLISLISIEMNLMYLLQDLYVEILI